MTAFFEKMINYMPLQSWGVITAMLAIVAVFYMFKNSFWKKIQEKHDNFFVMLFGHLNVPVQAAFLLTALFVALQSLPYGLAEQFWYQKAYTLTLVLLFTWIGYRLIYLACDLILKRFNVGVRDNLQARRIHTQVRVLRRLASAVLLIIAVSAGLMTFESIRSLGVSLIASAGVAGIVIGLAAQQTLGNFFTGLQIAITQPIRIDDAVVVEGEWGWIEEINLTYVVVKIWDLRRLVLPISYFVNNPFQNWTRTSADILGSVVLYLDYTMPLQPLRDELDRILAGTDLWDEKVKVVQVIDTTEKTMTVRILVSAGDSPTAWDLRCLVREQLIGFIQQNYPACLPRLRGELRESWPEREAHAS